MKYGRMTLLLGSVALIAAGCGDDDGDDDDTAPATAAAPATTAAPAATTAPPDNGDAGDEDAADRDYCDLARQLDEEGGVPSDEMLLAMKDGAPPEIAEHLTFVVDALLDRGVQAFFDDDVQEQFGPIETYELEVCGIEPFEEELPEGVSTDIDPDVQQVAVSATDYDFDLDAPNAGAVSFVMSNDGDEPHHMIIAQLADGVTLDDALANPDNDDLFLFDVASDVAGPGEQAVLTFENLEPGEYAMACFIPDDDGTPHAFLGMAVAFTVT